MNNDENKRNFILAGILILLIIVLVFNIVISLENSNQSGDLTEDNLITVFPLLLTIIILVILLSTLFNWGPFQEEGLKLSKNDGPILLLIITMFIVGFIIEPTLKIPKTSPNIDFIGLIILIIPISIITFMLINFQKDYQKKNILKIEEE